MIHAQLKKQIEEAATDTATILGDLNTFIYHGFLAGAQHLWDLLVKMEEPGIGGVNWATVGYALGRLQRDINIDHDVKNAAKDASVALDIFLSAKDARIKELEEALEKYKNMSSSTSKCVYTARDVLGKKGLGE